MNTSAVLAGGAVLLSGSIYAYLEYLKRKRLENEKNKLILIRSKCSQVYDIAVTVRAELNEYKEIRKTRKDVYIQEINDFFMYVENIENADKTSVQKLLDANIAKILATLRKLYNDINGKIEYSEAEIGDTIIINPTNNACETFKERYDELIKQLDLLMKTLNERINKGHDPNETFSIINIVKSK